MNTTTTTPSVLDLANQNGHAVQGDNNRAVSVFRQNNGWHIGFGRTQGGSFMHSHSRPSSAYRTEQRGAAERAIAKWLAS